MGVILLTLKVQVNLPGLTEAPGLRMLNRVFRMAKCIYCGAETELQVMGRPVCVNCVKDKEDGREPSGTATELRPSA